MSIVYFDHRTGTDQAGKCYDHQAASGEEKCGADNDVLTATRFSARGQHTAVVGLRVQRELVGPHDLDGHNQQEEAGHAHQKLPER